jgi:hypothetical protein
MGCILLLNNSVYANRYIKSKKGENKMEQEEKEQKTNEDKKSQSGCCDFSSEETQRMFKMMNDFCGGSEKDSSDCRSMMKEMMKNMSTKSDEKNMS